MARKATELFTVHMMVTFTFTPGVKHTAIKQFIKDAKEDIAAMFEQKCDIEVGKIQVEKKTLY